MTSERMDAMVETAEEFQNQMASLVGFGPHVEAIKARDAAVAHAARVGVLGEVRNFASEGLKQAKELDEHIVVVSVWSEFTAFSKSLAERHNITPAELEPVKGYGKDDITTDMYHFVADGDRYRVCTEDRAFVWHDKTGEWKSAYEGCGPFFYETTAKAIAAKLRADGNYPKGGGK